MIDERKGDKGVDERWGVNEERLRKEGERALLRLLENFREMEWR